MKRLARGHADVASLIPWYVNDTLGEEERGRVEEHVTQCEKCRRDLGEERRVYEAMSQDGAVEYIPAASLNRLRARLDAADARPDSSPQQPRAHPWWGSAQGLMAASVALMALALSLLAVERWNQIRSPYHTVTKSTPLASNVVIRAVFAPSVTLSELQGILDEAHLRIVSGPTEAGVYSLAQTEARGSVGASLALLRGHPKVRFAESTQLEAAPERLGSGGGP